MSLSWRQRKTQLSSLLNLKSHDDEDAEGVALDRIMHGQSVIGKTSKTSEIEKCRFQDRDLEIVGTLEYGQFGVIDVVTCRLNNSVYVRKSIEKKFALRTKDQCSPQFERDILLQALKSNSPWAPHLLCAFQTPTHLNLVMDYAEGGTLWDVLESSPVGRLSEGDLRWWAPQIVSAIHWCHLQGFVHRDVKPHNFVLTSNAHVLLIDFGSAAPLLPPNSDGTQLIPKRYCAVPCGTCDYISPEILQAHEEALLALEMEDDDDPVRFGNPGPDGYGAETDWWSLGAMLYEMAYGVAPFFANDIKQTYRSIMNHEKSLRFDRTGDVSHEFQHFLRRLLTHAKQRLGRRNIIEITDHPLFDKVDWPSLSSQPAPADLNLPQFIYNNPKPPSPAPVETSSEQSSQGFAFSAFFQPSSSISSHREQLTIFRPSPPSESGASNLRSSLAPTTLGGKSSFIGFSWGPSTNAFPEEADGGPPTAPTKANSKENLAVTQTPMKGQLRTPAQNPRHHTMSAPIPMTWGPNFLTTPLNRRSTLGDFATPTKPYALSPYATLPRTNTIRRTAPRRSVSDREAMKQLVDCVGMSARKKVLESGRKPKILGVLGSAGGIYGGSARTVTSNGMNGTGNNKAGEAQLKKELRFDKFATPIPGPDYTGIVSSTLRQPREALKVKMPNYSAYDENSNGSNDLPFDIYTKLFKPHPQLNLQKKSSFNHFDGEYESADSSEDGLAAPPSPSPSPRPGSAMSMTTTMMSKRSMTPTMASSGYSQLLVRSRSGSRLAPLAHGGDGIRSVSATTTVTTSASVSAGLLSRFPVPPSAHAGNLDFTEAGNQLRKSTTVTSTNFPPRPPSPSILNPLPIQTSQKSHVDLHPHSKAQKLSSSLKNADLRCEVGFRSQVEPDRLDEMWLDHLDSRHGAIMQDIQDLEERISEVSRMIEDESADL